jgi:acetyl esterase/lipase
MSKEQRDAANAQLRAGGFDVDATPEQSRRDFDSWAVEPDPADTAADELELGGRPTLKLTPPAAARAGADAGTLLYLHGGGYVAGSHRTGAKLARLIAERAALVAYSLDYRLAPERPFPAAVDDGLAAYRELVGTVDPARLVIAGDSAGGGLSIATLLAARDAGLPMPAAAVVFSPLVDQTHSGASIDELEGVDPLFTRAALDWFGPKYLGGADPRHPLASPALADLAGLPPLLIQVGAHEILLDDAIALARGAALADVDVTLEIGAELPHVFQNRAGTLDEADAALDRAGAFVRARLGARELV